MAVAFFVYMPIIAVVSPGGFFPAGHAVVVRELFGETDGDGAAEGPSLIMGGV